MSEIVPAGDHAGGGSSGEHGPTEGAEPVGVAPSSTESTAGSSGDLSLGLPLHPRVGDSIPPEVVEQLRQRRGQRTNARREAPVRRSSPGDASAPSGRRRRRGRRPSERGVLAPVSAVPAPQRRVQVRQHDAVGGPTALGRYLMCVHRGPQAIQIAVLEGQTLIEHYVYRPQDAEHQIDGNIYVGRVQNILPGMEAAFVDIGTPKNAVLYRGDLVFEREDVDVEAEHREDQPPPTRRRRGREGRDSALRIEDVLHQGQMVLCQVIKNPIGSKGARLSQEVSLPGRFVVLVPGSSTYGISKRLPDEERRRLRKILEEIRPEGHGLIVRTAAEGASVEELRRDVEQLVAEWTQIERIAEGARTPMLAYAEPDMAVRVIREEFNADYRAVVIDDAELYQMVASYVGRITPELADRVLFYDEAAEHLPLYERYRVHEQLHKALDRKVWLPSGGSLIIERTEALTVIDVNTGKNVGSSNLEETVFQNNLEAAEEVARQLRLRDIGGIIVIDFIDMEEPANREAVVGALRDALARDKTRSQVFDISELGLVEMTRKRISEGLVEAFTKVCPTCNGRGLLIDESLL
jgi:ribonuclease E